MSRVKRNYIYNLGDVVNALPNYTLTCTKAGITSADPITVQEGTITDGTCEWNCVDNSCLWELDDEDMLVPSVGLRR